MRSVEVPLLLKQNHESEDSNHKDSDTCSDSFNSIDTIVDDSDQNNEHEVNNLHNNTYRF